MEKELEAYLKYHNIKYIEHQHSAVFTVAESKKIKISIPGVHTKSLFLKDENNKYYLVCLPGDKRLNTKYLKEFLNAKELHFCSPEELQNELKVTPGSVSLFSMIHSKKTILILDEELWNAKKLGFHPNLNTSTLEIAHEGLKKFYDSLTAEKHIINIPQA